MEKIAIIGAGGRTGVLFAEQFKKSAKILGVAREQEVRLINQGKLLLSKKGRDFSVFKANVIEDKEFAKQAMPDYILMAVRYPVYPIVEYYYKIVKEKGGKIPVLILSQNGFEAVEEAISALQEVFREQASNVQIIRLNLFNPVDAIKTGDNLLLKYLEPVSLVFSSAFGPENTAGFKKILEESRTEFQEYQRKDFKNMEYSKLFLNLIGMASASWGKPVSQGFQDKAIFKEEAEALKEFILTVKLAGGKFINFKRYPVKTMADIINITPMPLLVLLRNILGAKISKGRGGKPKDLSEASHYNGAIAKMAQKFGIQAPVNIKIYNKIKTSTK